MHKKIIPHSPEPKFKHSDTQLEHTQQKYIERIKPSYASKKIHVKSTDDPDVSGKSSGLNKSSSPSKSFSPNKLHTHEKHTQNIFQKEISADLTNSIKTKIQNINNSIDFIRDESHKLQLYGGLIEEFAEKYHEELSEEFREIINKIDCSIQKINEKVYLLELNKLKRIIKTNSGRIVETTTHNTPDVKNKKSDKNIYNIEFGDLNSSSNSYFDSNTKLFYDKSITDEHNKHEHNECEYDEYIYDEQNEYEQYHSLDKIEKKNASPIYDLCEDYLEKIDFDVSIYNDKKILSHIAMDIFKKIVDFEYVSVDQDDLKKFITQVSLYYHNNPYHNFKHAISVLQFTYLLLEKTNAKLFLSPHEIFGILIGALVHDIDHPGNTNLFEINNRSNLALRYNDKSVLENHHCSLAFFIIYSKDIQLLKNLNESEFFSVREIIVNCVLGTDMHLHDDLMKKLSDKFYNPWDWSNYSDRILFAKIIVHVADLSNQVRPFDVGYVGSVALKREFQLQVEKEEQLNLPILDYMRVTNNKSFYKNEYFFSSNIVLPMWNIFTDLFENLRPYKEHLDVNISKWKQLLANEE